MKIEGDMRCRRCARWARHVDINDGGGNIHHWWWWDIL